MLQTSPSIAVRSLICHRDVNMAILCLGSLLKLSVEPIQFVLHEDGSLTLEDQEKLRVALNNPAILSRQEANEKMEELLKNYPFSRQYRREQVFGLKLLDTALLSQSDIAYCDTDILFLKPFFNLFRFPNEKVSAIFMRDFQEAYSIPISYLLKNHNFGLSSRVNAGLMFIRKTAYDLDFIEWFLKQTEFRMIMGWHEQTCWAALGHRLGSVSWNPKQITMIQTHTNDSNVMVAGHFATPFRKRLADFTNNSISEIQKPVEIETILAQNCNLPFLLKAQAKVYLGRVKRDVIKALTH